MPGAEPMSGDSSDEKQFLIVADARRRWTGEQKRAILAECGAGKASVSAVACKHAPNLLFRLRKDLGEVGQSAAEKPAFVPVTLRLRVDEAIDAGTPRRHLGVSATNFV